MNKICQGCGVTLQDEDINKIGYIPKEKIDNSHYCMRCYKLIHYGKTEIESVPYNITDILNFTNENAELVLFLTDFINVSYQIIDIYKRITKPKYFIITKSDIIPKNIKLNQIKTYLQVTYNITENIYFTNITSNLNTILKNIDNKNIFLLGETNAGKSTLINRIITIKESSNTPLTTSYQSSTTREFIHLKIGNMNIYDAPGFVLSNYQLNKRTNIKEEIKALSYQNKLTTTYRLENLFDITVIGNTSLVFYFSKNITIKRLYKSISSHNFTIPTNSDILIRGLGFIKVTKHCEVILPNKILEYVTIRPSITGGNYGKN